MKYFLLLILACVGFSCDDANEVSLPPTPYDLAVVRQSSTEISLTWKDSTTVGGNYKVYRAVNTSPFEVIATVAQGTLTYLDAAVTAEATYSYYLTLLDQHGNSSEYSAVVAVGGLLNAQMSSFTIPDKNIGDSPFAIATHHAEPGTYHVYVVEHSRGHGDRKHHQHCRRGNNRDYCFPADVVRLRGGGEFGKLHRAPLALSYPSISAALTDRKAIFAICQTHCLSGKLFGYL